MLLMSWHPIAARQAQNYADRCIFLQHNDARENTVPYLGSCGQNLFVASQKTPWLWDITLRWFGLPAIRLVAASLIVPVVLGDTSIITCVTIVQRAISIR
ncbi:unnamed protein product [Leptidea sinapis]|nr:unnamed protein product [Leptidea sinapis]